MSLLQPIEALGTPTIRSLSSLPNQEHGNKALSVLQCRPIIF